MKHYQCISQYIYKDIKIQIISVQIILKAHFPRHMFVKQNRRQCLQHMIAPTDSTHCHSECTCAGPDAETWWYHCPVVPEYMDSRLRDAGPRYRCDFAGSKPGWGDSSWPTHLAKRHSGWILYDLCCMRRNIRYWRAPAWCRGLPHPGQGELCRRWLSLLLTHKNESPKWREENETLVILHYITAVLLFFLY